MKTLIHCLIIDDERHARELLKTLLEKESSEIRVVDEATNFEEAKEKIEIYRPDLVFLDIKLKNRTAFELLECFESIDFQIIFTTAYSDFAIKAFEYIAAHYLLKPINKSQFSEAIQRVLVQHNQRGAEDLSIKIAEIRDLELQKVLLPNRTGGEFVLMRDIICCIAEGSYTAISLKGGKKVLVSKPLSFFEKKLNCKMFIRTHKKYLVNLREIVSINRARIPILTLSEEIEVSVSSSYKRIVLDQLMG